MTTKIPERFAKLEVRESDELLKTVHSPILDCFLYEDQVLYYKKYKTFFHVIDNYVSTRRYWENLKLCENTLPFGGPHNFFFFQFPLHWRSYNKPKQKIT